MKYPKVIYKITNDITGRVYIGSTARFEKRITEHFTALRFHRHNVEDMQKDFDDYGDKFSVEIIGEIKSPDESRKEYIAMQTYQSQVRGVGYNYCDIRPRVRRTAKTAKPLKRERVPRGYRNARAEMIRAGLTCETVGKIMGVGTATVSNWLTGRSAVTMENAIKFKKVVESDLPLEILFEEAV